MRYLTLGEALLIAEAVTGLDVRTLTASSRLDLLDSALHAPQAGFGDEDFYPELTQKAAVLVVRIARNHALLDGNKRLAWQTLTLFLSLNGHRLDVPADDAVAQMLGIASGELNEAAVAAWLVERVEPEAD
ncbi:MAG: type II toxin-antitoxin system death-on-curing family toxin [Mycobacterium sp.]